MAGPVLRGARVPDAPDLVLVGDPETGYEFAFSNIDNYTEALTRFWPQFSRSVLYGAAATVLTFLISYPLAYTIAFRGGRFKNLLLFLVVAPFFTSFLLRTISWKIILGDTGRARPAQGLGVLPADFQLLATPIAVVVGITYNFLPFMTLPIYVSLEKIDKRLVEAAEDLYAVAAGGAVGASPACLRVGEVCAAAVVRRPSWAASRGIATSFGAFRRITFPLAARRLRGFAADVHPGDG